MNVLKTLAVVGLAIGGYVAWDLYKPEGGVQAVIDGAGQRGAGPGGFVEMPLPDGVSARGVVVFTPRNCPSEAAQRARRLMSRLSSENVPYRQTDSAEFSNIVSQEQADQVIAVMEGPIPVVYVNGRAKANPSAEEVLAEYRSGG